MRSTDALEELEWWNSLSATEQEAAFVLTDEQKTGPGRRIAEHDGDPDSAIPWEEFERELEDRRSRGRS